MWSAKLRFFVRGIALDVRDNKGCREANSIPAIIGYENAEISKSVSSYLHSQGKEMPGDVVLRY